MKANLSKILKSGMALLLAVIMVVGLFPTMVFAAENEKKTYVSLGDSMTNGYGMPGYDHNGYLHNVPETYPELLAEAYNWNHIPLAISGMRAEDLQFILEFPWNDKEAVAIAERTPQMDGYTAATHGKNYAELWWTEVHAEKWYNTFNSGDFYTWDQSITQPRFNDSYYDVMAANGKGYGAGVENIARMIQESVAKADVISLAVGNANFGVFMRSLIVNALAVMEGNTEANMWVDLDRVLEQCDEKAKSTTLQIRAEALNIAVEAGFSEDAANAMVDAVAYTVASYLLNVKRVAGSLVEFNPDAEIIIVGLMNTLNGMEVQYNGQLIDLGKCMGAMIDAINIYLTSIPAKLQESGKGNDATFYFASASEVNMWVDEYETVANNWEKYPVIRDRFITKVCDTLFPLVKTDSWSPKTITRRDVEEFEAAAKLGTAAFYEYAQKNMQKAASVATYKAFENAIVKTYSMDAPDVTMLLDLQNGMTAVTNELKANYSANTEAKVKESWNSVVTDIVLPTMTNATLNDALAYVEQNAELKANITELCKLMATEEALTAALIENEIVCDLLSLLARLEIGDGIGCHPTTEGHAVLANAVIDAYSNNYTADKAMEDNLAKLLSTCLQLALEYGDDVYKFAKDNGLLLDATTAHYIPNENSFYTAFGDATVASTGYVKLVANEFGIGFANLAAANQSIDGIYDVIEANKETVAKSDLITIGYGNAGITNSAIAQMMAALKGQPKKEYDWAALVGEEYVPNVESVLAEVSASILSSDMDMSISGISLKDILMPAIEAYAYGTVSYIVNLPKAIEAIRDINPDAVVIIVGMHNPLSGTVLQQSGTSIELGAYVDDLIEYSNVYGTLLCLATGDAIFVEATEVETGVSNKTMGMLEFLMAYMKNPNMFNPTANSDEYVAGQIINSLDTTVVEEDKEEDKEPDKEEGQEPGAGDSTGPDKEEDKEDNKDPDNEQDKEDDKDPDNEQDKEDNKDPDDEQDKEDDKEEDKILLGDVDGNGIVNSKDAMLVAQYYAGILAEINTDAADVDGNGIANSKDAMQITQYYAGVITQFPAA